MTKRIGVLFFLYKKRHIYILYLLLSYCVLPLIKYNKDLDDTERYNKINLNIMIISNILIVIGMTYTMYLLLWYNDVYKKNSRDKKKKKTSSRKKKTRLIFFLEPGVLIVV